MLFGRAFERARGAFFRGGLRLRREGERGVVELTPLPLPIRPPLRRRP
jgi:hypothetical protein